jgi:hypothetical protein
MEYKFHKEYFLDNDGDTIEYGIQTIQIDFYSDAKLKNNSKMLTVLHKMGKPYVSLVGDDVEKVTPPTTKPKPQTKKKKVKIDEPKEEKPSINTESNEKES